MYERVRPVRLAGFLAIAGFAAAARFGGEQQVLLAAVVFIPVLFALGPGDARRPVGDRADVADRARDVWIGLAIAHAVLLRELPHGGAVVIDVLVGTFVGDSGAYFGGRALGTRKLAPSISPNKTVEGLAIGMLPRSWP